MQIVLLLKSFTGGGAEHVMLMLAGALRKQNHKVPPHPDKQSALSSDKFDGYALYQATKSYGADEITPRSCACIA